jgi:hypothetical protein
MVFSLVLLAYDRPHKLHETLSRLRTLGVLDRASHVEAFLDGPRNRESEAGVAACAQLLTDVNSDIPTNLHRHPINRGLAGIVRDLDWIFSRHERAVVVEDDILFEPEAVELLEVGWEWLEDLPDVMSIGLYQAVRFPLFPQRFFESSRFTCWGWMCTADKWNKVRSTPLSNLAGHPPVHAETHDILEMVRQGKIAEGLTSWDYVVAAQMLGAGMKQLVPRHSLSRNSGLYDGVHGSNSVLQRFHNKRSGRDKSVQGLTTRDVGRANSWYRTYMRLLTRT